MTLSSLVFVAIIGVWAAYLVPHWIRGRDQAVQSRGRDRFSAAARVLLRRREQAHPTVRRSSAGMVHTRPQSGRAAASTGASPCDPLASPAGSAPSGPAGRGPGRATGGERPPNSAHALGALRLDAARKGAPDSASSPPRPARANVVPASGPRREVRVSVTESHAEVVAARASTPRVSAARAPVERTPHERPSVNRPRAGRTPASRPSAARRRAQVLLVLALVTMLSWGLASTGVVPAMVAYVVSGLLVLDVVAGRLAVVRAQRVAAQVKVAKTEARTALARTDYEVPSVRRPVPTAKPMERPVSDMPRSRRPGALAGESWTPVPVPPPAYTLKPKAPVLEPPAAVQIDTAQDGAARNGDVTGASAAFAAPTRPVIVPPLPPLGDEELAAAPTASAARDERPSLDLDAVLDRRRAVNG